MAEMISQIAVVGAGTMGAGIAQLAAARGSQVHLIDLDASVLERAMGAIRAQYDRAVEKGRMTPAELDAAIARITPGTRIEALGTIALAVEAVVERLDVKHAVFSALQEASGPGAILATNTSSLPVSAIAGAVADPSRVVGMHFFNPAPVMPLVEIIAGPQSSAAAVARATEAAQSWGKTTVQARDTPGFIVNRVARGYYLEGLRLLGEGAGGVDEIDGIMRRHGRFRMGPFELMDLVGLDVNYAVSCSVWEQMDKPARLLPHPIQASLVERGHLGRKTGRGFYDYGYESPLPAESVQRRSFRFPPELADACAAFAVAAGATEATPTEQLIFGRILGAIMNEAALAYGEQVASAADIDTAMKLGTNYPKGPLEWAEEIRFGRVRALLRELNKSAEDNRYAPARLYEGTPGA